jgi:spermidine synthase
MTQPNLTVAIADGRTYLTQTTEQYDVVAVDAYRLPYIPWHLTTVEFFQQVREHLTAEGVVAINVGHTPGVNGAPDDWRLVDAMVATMRQVYPSVTSSPCRRASTTSSSHRAGPHAHNLSANLPAWPMRGMRQVAQSAVDNLRTPAASRWSSPTTVRRWNS